MSGFVGISTDQILDKYTESDLPMIYEYIGPNRTHGDSYLNPMMFSWFEFLQPVNYLPPVTEIGRIWTKYRTGGCPLGIIAICHLENRYLFQALHLSCIETLRHGCGDGTIMMIELEDFATQMGFRSITLQSRQDSFYEKLGYIKRDEQGIPIWRKYLRSR